ncbi:unnamed protein product [Linum tenue]|uniref:Phytocyanin domain-containing protein n=1 Tax=Linum tenue TaxID=586396 RepID=A0AAV0GV13_9ROSI|nr:unnamed protein product [Linum tenue]
MTACFLLTLSFFFFLLNAIIVTTAAEIFTVGDENGWTMQVNYGAWTDKHNFTVGDILEFKYTRTEHNVYEVTKEVYQSCNASDGVLAKYQTGNEQIELKEAKKHWFICEIDGHCLGGMRLAVDVAERQPSTAGTGSSGGAAGEPVAVSGGGGGNSGDSSCGWSNRSYAFGRCCSLFVYLVLVSACIWK